MLTKIGIVVFLCVVGWYISLGISLYENRQKDILTMVSLTILLEETFASGQINALNGDIRVIYDGDKQCWSWTKKPWTVHDIGNAVIDECITQQYIKEMK